jgi:hypothetical protein
MKRCCTNTIFHLYLNSLKYTYIIVEHLVCIPAVNTCPSKFILCSYPLSLSHTQEQRISSTIFCFFEIVRTLQGLLKISGVMFLCVYICIFICYYFVLINSYFIQKDLKRKINVFAGSKPCKLYGRRRTLLTWCFTALLHSKYAAWQKS